MRPKEIDGFNAIIKKKSGGRVRVVYEPNYEIRLRHQHLLDSMPPITWDGPLDHVSKHLKNKSRFFLKVDISDAYGNVNIDLLIELLKKRGIQINEDERRMFFHPNGGLIQGAPASPRLFNFYCEECGLDTEMREWVTSGTNDFVYTRFMDDIIISTRSRPFGRRILGKIREKLSPFNFHLNELKSQKVDSFQNPIVILGVELKDGLAIPTEKTFANMGLPGLTFEERRRHVTATGVSELPGFLSSRLSKDKTAGFLAWVNSIRKLNRAGFEQM